MIYIRLGLDNEVAMNADAEDQNDELLVLQSIYDSCSFTYQKDASDQIVGTLRISIETPPLFYVKVDLLDMQHEIHHLPPVMLSFSLLPDYPSTSPPQYSVMCSWLTCEQLKLVRQHLDDLWSDNAGGVILFTWASFLQNDLMDTLGVISPLSVSAETIPAILDYEQAARKKLFDVAMHRCAICLCDKVGAASMFFSGCDHVFCRSCTKEYLETAISDGSVVDILCPAPKCQTRVLPSQVKELVSGDLFERYDRLLLQRSLDMMADVHYCPRQVCRCPVLVDEKDAMGSCPACHYVFCIYCKMVYHGISPCKIISENMMLIREEYEGGNEATKRELERRYGRKNIRRIVEESFSSEWLQENCKKCPRCSTHIQKIDGCNKMSCTKCHAYFCWLCLTVVSATNPYSHFNVSTSPCYNRLFEGVDTTAVQGFDDDDDDGGERIFAWHGF